MSSNIDQIFIANPATELLNGDLFYIGRLPYGPTNDMAILAQSIFPTSVGAIGNLASYSDTTGKKLIDSGVNFAGGFTFTGTLTGNTVVTFPTSGILVTTAQIPSFPIAVTNGGTGLTSTVANQILYSTATSTIAGLATGNNGVLITSAGGVPSISSTLPAAVQGNITALGTIATGVWNGTPISLTDGGTNAALTASNGGLVYSTASAFAVLAGTATAGQIPLSGTSGAPTWSTTTYPATNAINTLLYASSANVMAALATVTTGVLTTVAGVPTWNTTGLPIALGGTAVTSVTTTPTASAWAGWDANKNLSANNFLAAYATTATAAATTTLTVASAYQQYFTGSTTQTILLPVTSTLVLGQQFQIVNNSSGTVSVESSGANLVLGMAANTVAYFTCVSTSGTTAASWNYEYDAQSAGSGTVTSVATGIGLSGGTITTTGTIRQAVPSAFAAYTTGTTTLAGSTSTKVIFAGVEFDTNSNFSSSRYTPQVAGIYQFTGVLDLSSVVFNNYGCQLYKNGVRYKDGPIISPAVSTEDGISVVAITIMNGTTDYVEIFGYNAAGTTVDVSNNKFLCRFEGIFIGPSS